MNYELGTGKPPWSYWKAVEAGKPPNPAVYRDNPLSKTLKRALGR